jgi:hypothetical protein
LFIPVKVFSAYARGSPLCEKIFFKTQSLQQ